MTKRSALVLALPVAGLISLAGCATSPLPEPDLLPRKLESTAPATVSLPAPSAPAAQERSSPPRQPWEFTIGGAGISNQDFDAGGAQVAGSVGYYFNDVLELSLRQNVAYADNGEGSPTAWNGVSRGALDLHLPLDRVAPYVGVNLGYAYGDTVKETLLAGPEAGVKFYLKDDVFLQVGGEYEFFFNSSDTIGDAFADGQFIYGLNLGMRF